MNRSRLLSFAVVSCVAALLVSSCAPAVSACACGCGIFEVGTGAMLPNKPGGLAFLEYDYMNQNQTWGGTSKSPTGSDPDKQLRTNFFTAGAQYMLDRKWGVEAELPYWARYFKTTDANGGDTSFQHAAVGDIRIRGIYSGLSADMSTGLTLGLKLPTGDFTYPDFDRDTEIGTGSTDALLGGYHMGRTGVGALAWFANLQADLPVLIAGGYRPGGELDAAAGAYYDGWKTRGVTVAPLAQVLGSRRWRDGGVLGHSPDTGYDRLFLSPGLELDRHAWRVYGDVGFPVYQHFNGNQLAAAQIFKLSVGYSF